MDIGLIAGGGQFPLLFSRKAVEKGHRVFAAGFKSDTDPKLESVVEQFQWLYLGQVARLIKYFKTHGITRAVLLGSIDKPRLFKDIRPDFKALKFIVQNTRTHDDEVLRSFADLMKKEGIEIISSTFLLPELLSPRGTWTQRTPDKAETADIYQGWKIARQIGSMDIGQCVVINSGTVTAVEAVDGTDATILRGGKLAGGEGAVVVKLCKPSQDLRFDLPSSGMQTIETMYQAGATVLVLEALKSLSFDRQEMIALADGYGITIMGLTDDDIK